MTRLRAEGSEFVDTTSLSTVSLRVRAAGFGAVQSLQETLHMCAAFERVVPADAKSIHENHRTVIKFNASTALDHMHV